MYHCVGVRIKSRLYAESASQLEHRMHLSVSLPTCFCLFASGWVGIGRRRRNKITIFAISLSLCAKRKRRGTREKDNANMAEWNHQGECVCGREIIGLGHLLPSCAFKGHKRIFQFPLLAMHKQCIIESKCFFPERHYISDFNLTSEGNILYTGENKLVPFSFLN
jgi:hypothetical protein